MTNNEIYHASFPFTLFRITPALRYIYFDIERGNHKKILLIAYYETSPSEVEKELMEDVASDIAGVIDEIFEFEVSIEVSQVPFDHLAKPAYLLYARFEGMGFD